MLQIFPAVLRNAPGNLVVVKPGWLYYNESIRARGPQGTVFYRRKNVKNELVIVLDFGGQYNQLVARRVRECNVYCEIYSYKTDIEKIKAMNPKGIILTGGPNSCYLPDSPTYSDELFKLGIPVLGLCYGAQLMMHVLGGKVEKADVREYGKTDRKSVV